MIRLMTMNDYQEILALWKRTPGMGLRSIDDSYQGIEKFLNRNPETCLVFEDQGIQGCLLCGHDGRRAYLYHVVVDPVKRGMGIGRQMVDHVIEILKSQGINKLCLVVFKDNEIGNTFWDHYGFSDRKDLNYKDLMINFDNTRL